MALNTTYTVMPMIRSIVAPDLLTAMRLFVSNFTDPTLTPYFISTDHAPSEQIDGSEWHTSALIISQSMEHQLLADELAERINPTSKVLRQWKGSNKHYRRKFHQVFFHLLKDHPLLVLIASSKKKTITDNEQHFASQLGILGQYRQIEYGKKYEFGPYIDSKNSVPKTLIISAKQAPMAMFIASQLLRVHEYLNRAINEKHANTPLWLEIWSDKPPNDFTGKYAELMWLLLGSEAAQGKFTWGGFTGKQDQDIDLLADNLAGLFNDITQHPDQYHYKGPELMPPIKGVFFMERLT